MLLKQAKQDPAHFTLKTPEGHDLNALPDKLRMCLSMLISTLRDQLAIVTVQGDRVAETGAVKLTAAEKESLAKMGFTRELLALVP